MLTSVHVFVGAAIGKATGNIYVTIPIAIVSHYLLDAIPHYAPKPVRSYKDKGLRGADKKDLLLKGLEPLLGVVLCSYLIYLTNNSRLAMITGGFFGWMPDFFVFLDWKYGVKFHLPLVHRLETMVHRHIYSVIGLVPQVVILVLAIIYILR